MSHQSTSKRVLEKKKIGKRTLWIGIIMLLALIITGLFVFTNKEEKKQVEKPKDPEEEIQAKLDYYLLVSSLNISELPQDYFGYFFKKDKYNQQEIDNQVKIYMAIRKVVAENPKKYEDLNKEHVIESTKVEKSLKEIFGKNMKINHESLTGNSCSYSGFKYDKEKNEYIQKPDDCEEEQKMSILMEQSNIEITDEKTELTVIMAFVDFNYDIESNKIIYEYYKDNSKQFLIGTKEQYDLDGIREQSDTYKFIFINKNGQFIFDSVEKMAK